MTRSNILRYPRVPYRQSTRLILDYQAIIELLFKTANFAVFIHIHFWYDDMFTTFDQDSMSSEKILSCGSIYTWCQENSAHRQLSNDRMFSVCSTQQQHQWNDVIHLRFSASSMFTKRTLLFPLTHMIFKQDFRWRTNVKSSSAYVAYTVHLEISLRIRYGHGTTWSLTNRGVCSAMQHDAELIGMS